MRGSISALACLWQLGCTTPNPAFGDTGGTQGMEATSSPTSGSTGTATTTTTGTGTGTPTTGQGTGTLDAGSSSTTDAGSNHCCNEADCDDPVRACMCELQDACCDAPWGPDCRRIAIACGGSCNGEDYPCCVPQPEPACSGIALLPGFCLAHPPCCLDAWTPDCVRDYDMATGECALGGCTAAHDTPGCDDSDVMHCVCIEAQLLSCCTEAWDMQCVVAAAAC